MDTTFMNFENSIAYDPHRQLLNLADKINLKGSDKCVALPSPSICYTLKNIEKSWKNINLKYQLQHGMKSLKYLMDHILYQIFKVTLNVSLKT